MSINDHPRADISASEARVNSRLSEGDPATGFESGLNPLYGSEIMGGDSVSSHDVLYTPSGNTKHAKENGTRTAATPPTENSVTPGAAAMEALAPRRSSSTQAKRSNAHGSSPQSTITVSTTHSSSSSRVPSRNISNGKKSVRRSSTKGGRRRENPPPNSGPPPLVPANLAPVPPPPPKHKRVRKPRSDVEMGGSASETTVMDEAPDKTLMEMIQSYLKKQNVYTRIVFIVLLLVLAGGVLGAYAIMLVKAIQDHEVKYIAVSVVFSLVIFWVVYKYCFSDLKVQDQSAIAQDIATLYAAIPDHTAIRGVSERGRAQFTSFKYEKSEMMFTAVTDDGVSLGSERGSELMMEGADPSCPLCNVAYEEGSDLCLLPCLHVFHENCIHKWCNRHIVCPLCKRHLEAPEPLHTLPGYGGGMAQSEPVGNGHDATGRQTWGHMLGTAAPGPASGHGSARGLGGTRSDDGLWNDRVLNAAQRQMRGGHNRVTSFSSETRRHNSARGRTGGPPQSSSAGTSVVGRSQSINTSSARVHQGFQRTRSSSFSTTVPERGRTLGRVAHGTAPHRGGASHRSGDPSSPRATSDLGVRSRGDIHMQARDDVLGRPAGGEKHAGEERSGNFTDGGGSLRKQSIVTVTSNKTAKMGVHSKGQGPAVITVRRVNTQPNGRSLKTRHSRGPSGSGVRSGGESESDVGAEQVFSSLGGKHHNRYSYDDDSPEEEVTTKALTYEPRKPRASSRDRSSFGEGPKHRRQSSTGSTSAEESGPGRRHRRRSSSSKPGSGNHSAIASLAATAEAVTKLLTRPHHPQQQQSDQRFASSSSKGGNSGPRVAPSMLNSFNNSNYNSAASEPESGADSGSDTMADVTRRSARGSARRPSTGRNHSNPGAMKSTPPSKGGPVTRGTPAPPMAAARVATWNSNASASAPVIDPSFSTSGDVADAENGDGDADDDRDHNGSASGATVSAETQMSSPSTAGKRGGSHRGWSIRIPSSTGGSDPGVAETSVTENLSARTKRSEKRSMAAARLFGSSSAARVGIVQNGIENNRSSGNGNAYGSDSDDDESKTEPLSESTGRSTVKSSSVQDLIKTYEKSRTSPDEKAMTLSDDPESRVMKRSGVPARKKNNNRRRSSALGTSAMADQMAAGATESEQDEDMIDRPKLSYRKITTNRRNKSTATSAQGVAAANDSGLDVSALELESLPPMNPDGEEWGVESPYSRPKLSYGGGLASASRKTSIGSDSGRSRRGTTGGGSNAR